MKSPSLTNTTGFIFVILGFLSIAYPLYSSLGIETLFGALFFVGGIFHLFGAFEDKNHTGYIWNFCVGVLYILTGVYLLSNPVLGLLALTIVLIALFLAQGILMLMIAFHQRNHTRKWVWAFFNGLITLGIAAILIIGYPISSLWAFGILIGINLLCFGISILMVNRIFDQRKV